MLTILQFLAIDGYNTTYRTVQEGTGSKVVSAGDTVTVHATGVTQTLTLALIRTEEMGRLTMKLTAMLTQTGIVKETGKKFWSTKDAGQQPFKYQVTLTLILTIHVYVHPKSNP